MKRQQNSRLGMEFRSWSTCVKFSSHFLFLSTSFLLSYYRDALHRGYMPTDCFHDDLFFFFFLFWERMGI